MRAWLEIDLGVIAKNYRLVKKEVGGDVGVIAVVKSDAYGHGLSAVAKKLSEEKAEMMAVISLEEAVSVRAVCRTPILILGYLDSFELTEAIEQGFSFSLFDRAALPFVERTAERMKRTAKVHLKVETGLNRFGMSVEEAVDFLNNQHLFPHVKTEAIYSHLAKAADLETDRQQLRKLQDLIVTTQGKAELLPMHLASSQALPKFKEGYLDAVRVGLALYGLEPVLEGVEPAMTCKAKLIQIKDLLPGEGVSYEHKFVAEKKMRIGVVSIGYGEGFTQALNGRAELLLDGQRCKVLGRICMNLCVVDLGDRDVHVGEEAVILGSQRGRSGKEDKITAVELAQKSGLSHYEIVTRLGASLTKSYV